MQNQGKVRTGDTSMTLSFIPVVAVQGSIKILISTNIESRIANGSPVPCQWYWAASSILGKDEGIKSAISFIVSNLTHTI